MAIPSPGVIDLLGLGVNVPATNIIGNTPSTGFNSGRFGADMGIGRYKPMVDVVIGTAVTTADSCTLNVQFQGAEDSGSGVPGTWQTFMETGPMTAAQLTANTVCARFDFPPAFPANFSPRFLRLNFAVPAAELFTAGTISYAIVTTVRDDQANAYAARNYAVS